MSLHEQYMLRCLELALKGKNSVAPNPLVGSVLVYQNRIIGEGWHQKYGEAHAEVNCLNSVSEDDQPLIPLSTLYVSLEPCSFHGKTPACSQLIINRNIPKVVIGCLDNHAKVSGKGVHQLKAAGIEVIHSVLEKECKKINRRSFTFQSQNRPYFILKWAESNDGFIAPANGARTQLSNASSQKLVHKMRTEEAAVLVGYKTALNDNPQLSDRFWKTGKQPTRVVLDFENSLPDYLHLFDDSQKTLIFNFHIHEIKGLTSWIKINKEEPVVSQILNNLKDINSIIIEGGSKTLQSFIDADLWDEAVIFKTPKSLGKGIPAPILTNSKLFENFNLGNDIVNLRVHERNHFYIQND